MKRAKMLKSQGERLPRFANFVRKDITLNNQLIVPNDPKYFTNH